MKLYRKKDIKCKWILNLMFLCLLSAVFPRITNAVFQIENIKNMPQYYSQSGSATYGIPIKIPPARGNFTPDLAIRYNSFSRNGWVGYGWDIGVAAIERSKKNIESGFVYRDNGNTIDLIAIEGSANYAAKIDTDYASYTFIDNRWIVKKRNGSIYYFGTTAASRQDDPSNATHIYKWCLDKIIDRNNNVVEFRYAKESMGGGPYLGQIYLKKIEYMNVGSGYINEVEFVLSGNARRDIEVAYPYCFRVETDRLLKEIVIRSNDHRVRKYVFQYHDIDYAPQYSLLHTIMECGRTDSDTLPPIEIKYYQSDLFAGEMMEAQNVNWAGTHYKGFADFNGNGALDFWYVEPNTRNVMVQLSNGAGLKAPILWATHTYNNWFNEKWKGFADINGDGKSDLWYVDYDNYNLIVKFSNGVNGFFDAVIATSIAWDRKHIHPNSSGMADFNGDGRNDFWWVHLYAGPAGSDHHYVYVQFALNPDF